jgi:guanosine-3',5'-bis(diphosphate) 3'-pyrophosphohydrolase
VGSDKVQTAQIEADPPYAGVLRTVAEAVVEHHSDADTSVLASAWRLALRVHSGQMRESGEEYVTHPLACAKELAESGADLATVAAGMLHDTIEESSPERKEAVADEIQREFGREIWSLVEGVTNLAHASFPDVAVPGQDKAARKLAAERRRKRDEDLKKILLAMARDFRVILIKFADRLHNMQTLSALSRDRQIANSEETLRVYTPLAHRLGMWNFKWRLEDLAFKHLYPKEYEQTVAKVSKSREEREAELEEARSILQSELAKNGMDATIEGRPKHLWSIYTKMRREHIAFEEIYDLLGLRIIVRTPEECYRALGVVNSLWVPIPAEFRDYIAKKKANLYQSLHTKVIGPAGNPLDIQIRTREMHQTAEFGIAAHWLYKEDPARVDPGFAGRLSWLRGQLFEWQTGSRDTSQFLRSAMSDLFSDQVFVFTPRGDVVDLPVGSTPIDFAYRIHTDLGNHCAGAKLNGKIIPLTYEFDPMRTDQKISFHNGDVVEIVARGSTSPSRDWLSHAKTSSARSRIRQWFRKQTRDESIERGKEQLQKEVQRLDPGVRQQVTDDLLEGLREESGYTALDDFYEAIGSGNLSLHSVMTRMRRSVEPEPEETIITAESKAGSVAGVSLSGDLSGDIVYRRGKCCMPIPGDDVVGYITRGKGIALHRRACPNLRSDTPQEVARQISVNWEESEGAYYPVDIVLQTTDRVGLLKDISSVFASEQVNVESANIETIPGGLGKLRFTVDVTGLRHLAKLMSGVSKLSDVFSAYRVGRLRAKEKRRP